MQTEEKFVKVVETRTRTMPLFSGQLVVYDRYLRGDLVSSVFTLESLGHCLGLPRSTLDGRYARGRLMHWKVDVPTMSGRPARGFPLDLLQQVIDVVTTRGARVMASPEGEQITKAAPAAVADLMPHYYAGKPYYTIAALADHFGVSETTVRKKLQRAGLMRRLVNLDSSPNGGRPRRGFPEGALGDVKLAIEGHVVFQSEYEAVLGNTAQARRQAQESMRSAIVPHTPPPAGSLLAFNHETTRPLSPFKAALQEMEKLAPTARNHASPRLYDVNAVNSLEAELEEIRKEEGIERPLTVGEQFEQELAQWLAECPDPAPGKATLSAPAPVERSVAEAPVLTPEQVQKAALEQAETTIMLTLKRTTKRPTPAHVREIVCGTYMLGEEHVQPLHDKLMAVWEELPEVEVDRGDEELVARANAQVDAAEGELTGSQLQELRYVIDRLMLPTAPRGTKPAVKRKVGARLDLEIDDAEQRRDAEFMSLVRDFTVRVQRGATLATLDVEAFLEDFFAPGNIYSKTLAGLDRQEATRRIEAARQHRAELLADPTAPIVPSLPAPEPEEELDPAAVAAVLKQLTKKGKK